MNPSRTPDTGRDYQVYVSPRRVAHALSGVTVVLVLSHLIFSLNYYYLEIDVPGATILYVLFDLMGEVTIPTWYASSLLLACSLLLAVIARMTRRLGGPFVLHWYGLSVIILLLSIDEAADVHGAVSYKLQTLFGLGGALSYPWVIPGALFSLIIAVTYWSFLAHLPPATRRQVLLAGGLFVSGALGMEGIEAAYDAAFEHRAPYLVMVAVEEALEMTGVILLIAAFLSYGGALTDRFRFVVLHELGEDVVVSPCRPVPGGRPRR